MKTDKNNTFIYKEIVLSNMGGTEHYLVTIRDKDTVQLLVSSFPSDMR